MVYQNYRIPQAVTRKYFCASDRKTAFYHALTKEAKVFKEVLKRAV